MTPEAREVFKRILSDTSRSFYVGIQALKPETQDTVCLGYLFCRLLDIVEDATSVDSTIRKDLLIGLRSFLETLPQHSDSRIAAIDLFEERKLQTVDLFESYFQSNSHEAELYAKSKRLLEEISTLSLINRKIFNTTLNDMARGMIQSVDASKGKPFKADDLDQYCYFVAGTVGLFLTQVFWDSECFSHKAPLSTLEEEGIAFGKALQLVNISKDFHKDWKENRYYWPHLSEEDLQSTTPPQASTLNKSFEAILALFDSYATKADEYISHLTDSRPDVKFFCEFPLEMAKANMALARKDRNWLYQGGEPKLSKIETIKIAQKLSLKNEIPNILEE